MWSKVGTTPHCHINEKLGLNHIHDFWKIHIANISNNVIQFFTTLRYGLLNRSHPTPLNSCHPCRTGYTQWSPVTNVFYWVRNLAIATRNQPQLNVTSFHNLGIWTNIENHTGRQGQKKLFYDGIPHVQPPYRTSKKSFFLVLVSPMVKPKPRIYLIPGFFRISQRSQNFPSSFFRGKVLKWMKPTYPISTNSKPRSVAPVMTSYVCWFINRIKYLLSEVPVGFT